MITFKSLSRRKPVVYLELSFVELSFFIKFNVIEEHIYKLNRFFCVTGQSQHIWFSPGSCWGYFSTSHLLTLNLRHLWGVYCKRISFKEGDFLQTRTSSLFIFDTVLQKIQQVQTWWQSVRNIWSTTSVLSGCYNPYLLFIGVLMNVFQIQFSVNNIVFAVKRFSLLMHENSIIAWF